MARRKGSKNKAGGDEKGKTTRKRRVAKRVDRNRASPFAVTQLYKDLTDDQRAAVVAMGQGPFLGIKCNSLHNPLNSWFTRCYDPSRRAFVVPCRGIIPLTEESVELLTGLPRGPLEVKYHVDGELEEQISSRLFPGEGSRPKVSDVAKRITKYKAADKTFKELWMVHLVSAVLAPTLDNHISNSCYPMLMDIAQAKEMNLCKLVVDQLHENLSNGKYGKGCLLYCMLRYITAINTDHLELELEPAPFAINSWTNDARDAVAALDMQEYDSTIFGVMQLRDEFKDVLSREMGLFGGPDGFEAWMKLNLHPTCSFEQSKRAHSLMLSFASSVNGALIKLVQGFTESVPCERCADVDAIKGGGNVSEVDEGAGVSNDGNNGSDADVDANSSSSEEDVETDTDGNNISRAQEEDAQEEQIDRGDDASDMHPSSGIGANKESAIDSTSTPPDEAGVTCTASPPHNHSQIAVPSGSELFGSDGAGYIGGFVDDSPNSVSQQADDEIRFSAAKLAASLTESRLHGTKESGSSSQSVHDNIKQGAAVILGIPIYNPLHKRKHTSTLSPTRKSPRVQKLQSGSSTLSPASPDPAPSKRKHSSSLSPTRKSPRVQNLQSGSSTLSPASPDPAPSKRKHSSSLSPTRKSPRVQKLQSGSSTLSPASPDPAPSKRKHSSSLSPTRKSPRVQNLQSGSSTLSPASPDPAPSKGGNEDEALAGSSPTRKSLRLEKLKSGSSTFSPASPVPEPSKGGNQGEVLAGSSKLKDDKGSRNTEPVSEADGRSAKSAFVLSPTVSNTPKQSMSDGRSAKSAVVISPTVRNSPKQSMPDGSSANTAFVVSPSVAEQKKSDGTPNQNMCRDIVLSPQVQPRNLMGSGRSSIPLSISPNVATHLVTFGAYKGSQTAITPDQFALIKGLSDSFSKQQLQESRTTGKKPMQAGGSGRKRKHDDIGKIRDNRPGMFTPPPFNIFSSEQETSSNEEPVDARPVSWVPSTDASDHGTSDDGFKEYRMSEELQLYIAGVTTELSTEGEEEYALYEQMSRAFFERKHAIEEKAKAGPIIGVQSLTPKAKPQKARVKRVSRFKSSPYDSSLTVTADQEDVYRKILLSSNHHRDKSSKIKSFRIILYKNCWAFTGDLADSIHVRGELSNSCMEVAIEYLQKTNTIPGKKIMPYLVSKYLMDNDFMKPLVIEAFKRTPTYSLSVMKRVHFPVMHEICRGEPSGNHWYFLCLNLEAERFEALDSLRGESNAGLLGHANGFIDRIKSLWSTYYHDSKVQIEHFKLKVIDAPKQSGIKDCGYHVLHNIENWDGQNIPQINKDDVVKMRKLFPYKWVTASFNEQKDWRWHLDNNKMERM